NQISGTLKGNFGNPISNVGVYASATIGGNYVQLESVNTDNSGYYALVVANTNLWTVGVLSGCSDCGNQLPSNYLCGNQTVSVSNNNPVVNLTALIATNQISGQVQDSSGNPVPGVGVYANA